MKPSVFLTGVVLLLATFAGRAAAHGGGDLVAGPVQTGPYTVSVWVNPPQPRAGEPVHFTVGVAAPGDGAPVLDAEIMITMADADQAIPPVTAPATTDQSINRLFYETDLDIAQPGQYATLVSIDGPDGSGEITIDLEVLPPSPFNWFWLGLAGLGIMLLVGLWQRQRASAT